MASAVNKTRIVLIACGSFNPITNMHLRLFELAKDALHASGKYEVIAGLISPVSDGYAKKGLLPAKHRCAMVNLATSSSDWIRLDSWESQQTGWLETIYVLKHHMQQSTTQTLDTNCNEERNDNKESPTSAAKRRKLHVNDVDNNNPVTEDSSALRLTAPYEVRLLCGADVLESFNTPGLWKTEHMEEILEKIGAVVCQRSGCRLDKLIYESDLMTKYKANITIVTEWIANEISATKIRRALKRGESVRYLLQDSVVDYIRKNNLYATTTVDSK